MSNPVKKSLQADKKYFFCTCGKSADGVMCDGSHTGSEFKPQAFSVSEDKDYFLCSCKKSNKLQFCDGSHAKS